MKGKLRVLIAGQHHNFTHVLATTIRCWGYEAVILPTLKAEMRAEVEGDIVLYDVDEFTPLLPSLQGKETSSPQRTLTAANMRRGHDQWSQTHLTIALSSQSISRTIR